jgi:hypothetical protein
MPILRMLRCPECGTELPIRELLVAAPKDRRGRVDGAVGLTCSGCYTKLRLQQWLEPVVTTLIIVLLATIGLVVKRHLPDYPLNNAAVLVALGLVAIVSSVYLPTRLARFRILKAGEVVQFPLQASARRDAEDARVQSEFVAKQEAERLLEFEASRPWQCDTCHEENPQEFLICWKCEAELPLRFRRNAPN